MPGINPIKCLKRKPVPDPTGPVENVDEDSLAPPSIFLGVHPLTPTYIIQPDALRCPLLFFVHLLANRKQPDAITAKKTGFMAIDDSVDEGDARE